jgi:hypothetical protein
MFSRVPQSSGDGVLDAADRSIALVPSKRERDEDLARVLKSGC